MVDTAVTIPNVHTTLDDKWIRFVYGNGDVSDIYDVHLLDGANAVSWVFGRDTFHLFRSFAYCLGVDNGTYRIQELQFLCALRGYTLPPLPTKEEHDASK